MAKADYERARELYPSVTMGESEWVEALDNNHDIMWAIIADVYDAVKTEEERDGGLRRLGRRPGRSSNSIAEVWDTVFPAQFSMDPFPLAFEKLLAGRSQHAFARKIPCNQGLVSRLLSGQVSPDLVLLQRVAAAAKVPPYYFVEFRSLWLGHLVTRVLEANPHLGVTAIKKVRATRPPQ